MKRKLKSFRRWLILFSPVIILILFYLIENTRGYLTWQRYQKTRAAEGGWFDFSEKKFTQPEGPKFNNDFTIDPYSEPNIVFKSLTPKFYPFMCEEYALEKHWAKTVSRNQAAKNIIDQFERHSTKRQALHSQIFGAVDIARDFSETEMDSNFTPYDHLNYELLIGLSNLEAGNVDEAVSSLLVLMKLSDMYAQGPGLPCVYLRYFVLERVWPILWEGLKKRKWTEAQLASLQKVFNQPRSERLGIDAHYYYCFKEYNESFENDTFRERLKKDSYDPFYIYHRVDLPSWVPRHAEIEPWLQLTLFKISPNGWLHLSKIDRYENARYYHPYLEADFKYLGSPLSLQEFDFEWDLESISSPQYLGAELVCRIRLAALAIAAERYWLARGKYPKSLQPLAKYFDNDKLPEDAFSKDRQFGYLPAGTRGDRPVFYSLGRNMVFEEALEIRLGRRSSYNSGGGDLVWQYQLPKGFTFKEFDQSEVNPKRLKAPGYFNDHNRHQ